MTDQNSAQDPAYDVLVWGASGFVGKLICEYLIEEVIDNERVRWAMGGRNQEKLEGIRAELGEAAKDVPIVTADAADEAALEKLVKQAKVVLTTVGPYAKYGTPLIAACARHGVDYVDLTGEAPWVRNMIDTYEEDAKKSGARIVPCCGFDSIPSDLGVYFLDREVKKQKNAPCPQIKMRVHNARGGMSGGTIDSMLTMMEEAGRDPSIRQKMNDRYLINPADKRDGPKQPSDTPVEYDADAEGWIAPFVMAGVNTRVVHRSNALLDYAYGRDFLYDEAMYMGEGVGGAMKTFAMAGGMGAFMGAMAFSPARNFIARFLPKPGEGPSQETRETGFYDLRFIGKTEDGEKFNAQVTGDRDPGYGSTAKMIVESALCLAFDVPKSQVGGGFWTPASAMGDPLLKRLVARAGLTFDMV